MSGGGAEPKEFEDARIDLSILMARKPYLRRWVGAEFYPVAKAHDDARIKECRDILHNYHGATIWYYKSLPTMGNRFGGVS